MHFIPSFILEGFSIGPFYIYSWGLMAAIGVLITLWLASKKFDKIISSDQFWNLAIKLVALIFIGARISYILENWNYYVVEPIQALKIWEGGFSFFGGAIGGILYSYLWSKRNKIDFFRLGWIFTPAWLFGLFFGRIGCFLIHDHLGKTTTLPWGVWIQGAYRHEPAMYEALWLLLIGIVFYLIDRKIFAKILFPLSLIFYSFGRFWLDFLRADPSQGQGGDDYHYYGLTVAQWVAILITVWSTIIIIRNRSFFSKQALPRKE